MLTYTKGICFAYRELYIYIYIIYIYIRDNVNSLKCTYCLFVYEILVDLIITMTVESE